MNRPIKVLFALPNLHGGGAERVFVHLLRHLDRGRFQPQLALGAVDGPYLPDLPADTPPFELGASRARGAVLPLVRLVRQLRPDIVFTTLGFCVAAALARPLLPRKTRLVMRLGNSITAYLDDVGVESAWKKRAYTLTSSLIYYGADRLIAQSDFMIEDAVATLPIGRDKFRRIYNPVDVSRITELSGKENISFPGAGPHLVSVGRLHRQKGFDLLLPAFAEVRKRHRHATLTVLGEGELRGELSALAATLGLAGSLRLPGFVDNPYAYLRAADLCVSSSRYEGFANVLLESLALGTPVVATDCPGGNRELVSHGVNGWLAPPDSAQALAETICAALSSCGNLDRGRVASSVRDYYHVSKICNEYEQIFVDVMSDS